MISNFHPTDLARARFISITWRCDMTSRTRDSCAGITLTLGLLMTARFTLVRSVVVSNLWCKIYSGLKNRIFNFFLIIFSRSYCYIVWSAIGIILSSVCLSVCLWRCALWLSRLVYRAKSCASMFLAGIYMYVPICPFGHFCCRMYRLVTKRTTKKIRKREREFFTTTFND